MADHMAWICCACTIVYEYISPLFHIYKWYIYRHICERQTLIGCCLTGRYFSLPASDYSMCFEWFAISPQINTAFTIRCRSKPIPFVGKCWLQIQFGFDLVVLLLQYLINCYKCALCQYLFNYQIFFIVFFFLVELPFLQFLFKFLHNRTIEQQKKRVV